MMYAYYKSNKTRNILKANSFPYPPYNSFPSDYPVLIVFVWGDIFPGFYIYAYMFLPSRVCVHVYIYISVYAVFLFKMSNWMIFYILLSSLLFST